MHILRSLHFYLRLMICCFAPLLLRRSRPSLLQEQLRITQGRMSIQKLSLLNQESE